MARQTEIFIDINKEGQATVEVSGHVGPGCGELTKNIERALGEVASDTKKPEFYRKAEQKQTTKR